MPRRRSVQRARRAAREGKAQATQAGAFVGEEIQHVRPGKRSAGTTKALKREKRSFGLVCRPVKTGAVRGTQSARARERAPHSIEPASPSPSSPPSYQGSANLRRPSKK